MPPKDKKNPINERELETLKFWRDSKIFEKSINKPAPKGEFIFYEGPPTANGKPGIHHLEARAFKDAIPRYKTMRGFRVRRKGGWDTHGLPVEIAVEKELGLKSKKEIEKYGIAEFNEKCRESVWKYVKEWEEFTDRIGYWIDLKRPYVTYKPYYIESVWHIVSQINEQGLLYKDYKVVPWCPRCGTALSSHELAQGYEDVKDLSVYVKFKIKNQNSKFDDNTYLVAWTTTPWTLPGNVALAVGKDIEYVKVKIVDASEEELPETYIVAKNSLVNNFPLKEETRAYVAESTSVLGKDLVGLEYEPLYSFLKDNLPESEKPKLKNAFKVYAADFVTTADGTGIVHTAVMYGTDDFELGTKVGLPKYHLVDETGHFIKGTGMLEGKSVNDKSTAVDILKDLQEKGLYFGKEDYPHSYPHCWRCQERLIYFARDSWYIKMSDPKIKKKLLAENQKINWEPTYIKDGRFGEWLKEVKDWAISRERYWGTPLPVWQCESCGKREVVGSFDALFLRSKEKKLTRLLLVRHGESEKNVLGVFDSSRDKYPLTKAGEREAKKAGEKIKKMGEVAAVYASPVLRTRQTAEIIGKDIGKPVSLSDALWEVRSGEWDGKSDGAATDRITYNKLPHDIYYKTLRGKTGESWSEVEERVAAFVGELLRKHQGQTVVLVSHEGPLMTLMRYLKNLSLDEITNLWDESRSFHLGLLGGYAEPTAVYVDSGTGKEVDPHRPFIDAFKLVCHCGGSMTRVKEVMDVWFDSGAMPFAEEHYPFKNKQLIDTIGYPADFISEAIDQTRGWFYTLHGIGVLLGKGRAYKNVICLGHILDAEGKKMSKSLGNVIDPNQMMEKYGADALRFWMYSVNQPGEPKNFEDKTVDEIVKKVFNLASNVLAFFQLYSEENPKSEIRNLKQIPNSKFKIQNPEHILDKWIIVRLNQLVGEVTANLEAYKLLEPTRATRDFIADLSQWYLRRSRERIKKGGADSQASLATLGFTLRELSKIMAPFTPFFAEHLYKSVGGEKESVHLEEWPAVSLKSKVKSSKVLEEMLEARRVVSLALEARAKANIKVRQPLQRLAVRSEKLKVFSKELLELIKDEVNVKEILFDSNIAGEVSLDMAVTAELKEEGNVRELVRAIQELRKEMKLSPSSKIVLSVETDEQGRTFWEKHKSKIGQATLVEGFVFESALSGRSITSGDFSFKVERKR